MTNSVVAAQLQSASLKIQNNVALYNTMYVMEKLCITYFSASAMKIYIDGYRQLGSGRKDHARWHYLL